MASYDDKANLVDDEHDDLDDFVVDNDDDVVFGAEQKDEYQEEKEREEEVEEEEEEEPSSWVSGDPHPQRTIKGGHLEKKIRHNRAPPPAGLAARRPCSLLSRTDLVASLGHPGLRLLAES